ncbi:uncharacterized protein ACIBXB_005964 isoform 4-T4 [Morphnus guianensis]
MRFPLSPTPTAYRSATLAPRPQRAGGWSFACAGANESPPAAACGVCASKSLSEHDKISVKKMADDGRPLRKTPPGKEG